MPNDSQVIQQQKLIKKKMKCSDETITANKKAVALLEDLFYQNWM